MKLTDLKIRTRLGINFVILIFFTILITSLGIINLANVMDSTDEMKKMTYKLDLSQEWLKGIELNSVRTFAKAKNDDPEDAKYFQEQMEGTSARVTEITKELETLIVNEKAKEALKIVGEKRKEYSDVRKKVFAFKDSKGKEGEAELYSMINKEMVPLMNAYINSVKNLVDIQKNLFAESQKKVLETAQTSKSIMITFGVIAIIIGSVFAWLLSRSITKPLSYAVEVAKIVASGDLSNDIKVNSKDETGQLLLALKEMNNKLVDIVGQVRTGTDVMSTASTQIAAGNLDLSSRTEEQASSLEETASAMEELTSTVQQNADNAKQANQLANTASEISKKGGAVVSQVVNTMKDIDESSKKIVDIISVIDSIAFQTNILSLNAAVEAARAGEQGRGFAVVASEVRNLAQKSAAAAKEIKQLISNSVEKVQVGVVLVDEAGNTMSKVVDSIKRVTDIMDEISSASQEQALGIEQVNKAITQMDEVTQQNAALVEEAAAASASMQQEAANLSEVVSVFKI
jgi:methyl-accepting chemotaxis protein